MNHIKTLLSLNITPGVHWHGGWEAGRVEGNRQLYDYELVFFSAGRGRIVFPECTFHCVEGSVAIVPPGSVHCTIADEPVHRWCIHFDWRGEWQGSSGGSLPFVYLDSRRHFNASEAALPPPPELQMTFPFFLELRDEELEHFRGRVQEYFDDGRENLAGALNRKGLLLQLLSMLVHSESRLPKSADNRHFLRAKSFLDSNYALPSIGLQETAAAVNVTPNHLSKIFRQACGRPVLQYLLDLRLGEAKRLLRGTQMNISEIAVRTGFADPNYFTRYFRKRWGLTPGQYRARH